jgi:hypothetical protein
MKCNEVREAIPAYAGESILPLAMRRHIAGCADCRAEAARYESLMAGMRDLEALPVETPVGLRAQLVGIPVAESRLATARTHVVRNRKAYLGGLAVAVVGAGAAAMWRTRSRRLATA